MLTLELLKQHEAKSEFVLLTVNSSVNLVLHIADAIMVWKVDATILFHTGFRLAGSNTQIRHILGTLRLAPSLVEQVMSSCLTATNYLTTMKSAYDAEVTKYQQYLRDQLTSRIFTITPTNPFAKVTPVASTTSLFTRPTVPITTPSNGLGGLSNARPQIKVTPRAPTTAIPSKSSFINKRPTSNAKFDRSQVPLSDDSDDDFENNTGDVDIFDFEKYAGDFELCKKYYSDIELYLRAAIWISYKHCDLPRKVRLLKGQLMNYVQKYQKPLSELVDVIIRDDPSFRLMQDIIINPELITVEDIQEKLMLEYQSKVAAGVDKEWLDNLTNIFEGQQLMWSWYSHFKPHLISRVSELHRTYGGRQLAEFFNALYRRSVDATHIARELWF